MSDYPPGWDEEVIRAVIKFPRGKPRLDEHCVNDPIPWQRNRVFHPTPPEEPHGQE
jgi:hypothetical protein